MSEMKMIMENWRNLINEQSPVQLNTYGDLRKQLELAKSAKSKDDFKGFALGVVTDLLGIDVLASGINLIKNMYSLPDNKKTNTVLDTFLNVDDKVSAIVDDKVENQFLNAFIQYVRQQPADRLLRDDNITQKLLDYLSSNYDGRTLVVP